MSRLVSARRGRAGWWRGRCSIRGRAKRWRAILPVAKRETKAARIARTSSILERLGALYPESRCSLDHEDPLQLLLATVLSAQCTDARVNQVTPALFARYPDAEALATADPAEVEEAIRSVNYYRTKARALIG
ncbi:MAG: hypothetical protein H0X65_15865, partial [Gemmatimonadetes bacterium]|nr:hypothetical protein [Gemmatimonadota bacterium]